MRVLYCNIALRARTGTEIVTIETALGLQRRGHKVAVLVGDKGPTATILEERGICVLDDTRSVPFQPDVVHSNHFIQSIDAAAVFPDAPQIFMCHDVRAWHSQPPPLSIIRRWIAVDALTKARLEPIAELNGGGVDRLGNCVDLERFPKRKPLPVKPERALLLTKNRAHLDSVREACANKGILLDEIGPGVGKVVDDLHKRLGGYDVVFATGRMALEAIASGCAVVVIDGRGLAGMATPGLAESWREQNFGLALLTRPLLAENVQTELDKYDALEAQKLSDWVRKHAALEDYLGALCRFYEKTVADFAAAPTDPRQTLADLPLAFRHLLPDWPASSDPKPFDRRVGRLYRLDTVTKNLTRANANLRKNNKKLKETNTRLKGKLQHRTQRPQTLKALGSDARHHLKRFLASVAPTPLRWARKVAAKLR